MTELQSTNCARRGLVARINFFDDTSLISTNVTIVGLTQETHLDKGSSELSDHQFVIGWKFIRSDGLQCI